MAGTASAGPGVVPPPSVTGFSGRFQFQLPEKFKGTKDTWEEFTFQFKAYLSLIDPNYEKGYSGRGT